MSIKDGVRIDRLVLTTDTTFIPTGFGPAETERQLGGDLILPITRTIVYTYDNLYRLTGVNYQLAINNEQIPTHYEYSYDKIGNRLQEIIDGDTTMYLYDAANRLWQVDGQNYTFDDNGNLLNTGSLANTFDAACPELVEGNAGPAAPPRPTSPSPASATKPALV